MIKNKTKLAVAFFVLIGAFAVSYYFWRSGERSESSAVCIKNICYSVEVADTPSKREYGLMNRAQLGEDRGMLFIFEKEDVYKFWMKGTLIPLDIIWMDKDGKIVYIRENVEPCKSDPCEIYGPGEKAKYVLEINGGLVSKRGMKIGDVAIIEN